jgi:cupin 2 domain-containing protein
MNGLNKGNIFIKPEDKGHPESLEVLLGTKSIRIEKIFTSENFTAPGPWYDQDWDEWVVLLEGTAELEFESGQTMILNTGDYVLIKAHQKHRVVRVSQKPGCLWLAVHGDFK